MRRFYLENHIGRRLDLNGRDGYFVNPRGLGAQAPTDAADLGQGFFVPTNTDRIPRDRISGSMVFVKDQGYSAYRAFVNFLMEAKTLTLIYIPYGTEEFCRAVALTSVEKSELGSLKWLTCPISFSALTPWYKAVPKTFSFEMAEDLTPSKRYDYSYDYTYLEQLSAASVELSPEGHYPASLSLTYTGALVDPVITLTGKQSGKIYGECSLDVTAVTGDTLEYSSKMRDSYVRLTHNGTVTDLILNDLADLTKEIFFRVPLDEICVLKITADNQMSGQATLAMYEYYRSV